MCLGGAHDLLHDCFSTTAHQGRHPDVTSYSNQELASGHVVETLGLCFGCPEFRELYRLFLPMAGREAGREKRKTASGSTPGIGADQDADKRRKGPSSSSTSSQYSIFADKKYGLQALITELKNAKKAKQQRERALDANLADDTGDKARRLAGVDEAETITLEDSTRRLFTLPPRLTDPRPLVDTDQLEAKYLRKLHRSASFWQMAQSGWLQHLFLSDATGAKDVCDALLSKCLYEETPTELGEAALETLRVMMAQGSWRGLSVSEFKETLVHFGADIEGGVAAPASQSTHSAARPYPHAQLARLASLGLWSLRSLGDSDQDQDGIGQIMRLATRMVLDKLLEGRQSFDAAFQLFSAAVAKCAALRAAGGGVAACCAAMFSAANLSADALVRLCVALPPTEFGQVCTAPLGTPVPLVAVHPRLPQLQPNPNKQTNNPATRRSRRRTRFARSRWVDPSCRRARVLSAGRTRPIQLRRPPLPPRATAAAYHKGERQGAQRRLVVTKGVGGGGAVKAGAVRGALPDHR